MKVNEINRKDDGSISVLKVSSELDYSKYDEVRGFWRMSGNNKKKGCDE